MNIAPFDVVWAYSQAGDRDRTLTWLVKAVDARDPNISAMVTDPQFDSLRGDARFLELLAGQSSELKPGFRTAGGASKSCTRRRRTAGAGEGSLSIVLTSSGVN